MTRKARKFDNDEYRRAWLETHTKQLIAAQFRAMRRDERQEDFGQRIGVSQSVVARYENPAYGSMTVNTLLDVAKNLKVGLLVKFVPFSRVMDEAKDLTASDLAPISYSEDMEQRDREMPAQFAAEGNVLGGGEVIQVLQPFLLANTAAPSVTPLQNRVVAVP